MMEVTTLLFTILTVSTMLGLIVILINKDHPSKGMALGGAALGSIAAGSLILACWPVFGTQISVIIGYPVIAVGLSLISEALLDYQSRDVRRWIIWFPVPILFIGLLWLLDDIPTRTVYNAIISSIQVIIFLALSATGYKKTPGWGWRIVTMGGVAHGAGAMIRGIAVYQDAALAETLLTSNWVQSSTYLLSLNGLIFFAIGLVAMSMEKTWTRLAQKEEELRSYIENANDVVYMLNSKGDFEYLSPNIENSLGHKPEKIIGSKFTQLVHPDDISKCNLFFENLITTLKPQAGLEYRAQHIANGWQWHDTNAAPLFDDDGKLRGILGIGRDINERKLYQDRLEHFAQYDALTGLYNRYMIIEQCENALSFAKRNGTGISILFLDMDGFKNINDRYGHDVGDTVLAKIANRLKMVIRKSDSVGRLGGDEYLVLLSDIHQEVEVLETAKRILAEVSIPINVDDKLLVIGCSVGIASYPQHDVDAKELIRRADQAMYESKRRGGHSLSQA